MLILALLPADLGGLGLSTRLLLPDSLWPHAQDVEARSEATGYGDVANLDQICVLMIHNQKPTESNLRG